MLFYKVIKHNTFHSLVQSTKQFLSQSSVMMLCFFLSLSLTGRLGTHPFLESQPVGDDPHVPLSHGANLLYVVGNFDPVGRDQHSHGLATTPALLNRPCSAYIYLEPPLDSQEDHAAAQPGGLELRQQAGTLKWSHEGPV